MIHVSAFQDLAHLAIHKVGNSSQDEPLICSQAPLDLQDEAISQLLLTYFIQPFNNNAEYFRFYHEADLQLNEEDDININKLDKGCLIFNIEEENGYKVSVIDSISKQNEAVYWKDAFL